MVTSAKSLFQHFRPEEQSFIEKSFDLIDHVESTYAFQVTEFLNPRQVSILVSLVAKAGLKSFVSSDYFDTEYAKVLVSPEYYEFDQSDFEISLLELTYNPKFNHLTHRQMLGTLINQLGVKRSVFGDILLAEGCAQILVESSLASYFIQTITKIGKVTVQLKEVSLDKILPRIEKTQAIDILSASWRVDAILGEALKLSRANAVKLIEKDKVKLNFASLSKSSQELEVGDLLSIRGYGRYRIAQFKGLSKSEKIKLVIERITEQ